MKRPREPANGDELQHARKINELAEKISEASDDDLGKPFFTYLFTKFTGRISDTQLNETLTKFSLISKRKETLAVLVESTSLWSSTTDAKVDHVLLLKDSCSLSRHSLRDMLVAAHSEIHGATVNGVVREGVAKAVCKTIGDAIAASPSAHRSTRAFVLLFYGSSGCGKTHVLGRCPKLVADFFEEKYTGRRQKKYIYKLELDVMYDPDISDAEAAMIQVADRIVSQLRAKKFVFSNHLTQEQIAQHILVLTIDEIGRFPNFTQALIRISRALNDSSDPCVNEQILKLRNVFSTVFIFAAGTGGELVGLTGCPLTWGSDPTLYLRMSLDLPQFETMALERESEEGIELIREGPQRVPSEEMSLWMKAMLKKYLPDESYDEAMRESLLAPDSPVRNLAQNARCVTQMPKVIRSFNVCLTESNARQLGQLGKISPQQSIQLPNLSVNPYGLHDWGILTQSISSYYIELNSLNRVSTWKRKPFYYSSLQLVMLEAVFLCEHAGWMVPDDDTFSRAKLLSRRGLIYLEKALQRNDRDRSKNRMLYRIVLPPAMAMVALSVLGVRFGAGPRSKRWECGVLLQFIGLRYAAVREYHDAVVVKDLLPGIEDFDGTIGQLTVPIVEGRGWLAMQSSVSLNGMEVEDEVEAERPTEGKVWEEAAAVLAKKHAVVVVLNMPLVRAADGFALIRIASEQTNGADGVAVVRLQIPTSYRDLEDERIKLGYDATKYSKTAIKKMEVSKQNKLSKYAELQDNMKNQTTMINNALSKENFDRKNIRHIGMFAQSSSSDDDEGTPIFDSLTPVLKFPTLLKQLFSLRK